MLTNVIYIEHLCLLGEAGARGAEFSHRGVACIRDYPLIRTLDTKAHVSFPGWQQFARFLTHHCWEIKCIHVILLTRHLETCTWFILDFVQRACAFADFNLYFLL